MSIRSPQLKDEMSSGGGSALLGRKTSLAAQSAGVLLSAQSDTYDPSSQGTMKVGLSLIVEAVLHWAPVCSYGNTITVRFGALHVTRVTFSRATASLATGSARLRLWSPSHVDDKHSTLPRLSRLHCTNLTSTHREAFVISHSPSSSTGASGFQQWWHPSSRTSCLRGG
jgi:hypothetical protein